MRNKWFQAIFALLILGFTAYLLTWPEWHKTSPPRGAVGSRDGAGAAKVEIGRPVVVQPAPSDTEDTFLPYTVRVDAGNRCAPGQRSDAPDCYAYSGNEIVPNYERGDSVDLTYLGEQDEPDECAQFSCFTMTKQAYHALAERARVERSRAAARQSAQDQDYE